MARAPLPSLVRPQYKYIREFHGGLNKSLPPDQLADNESSNILNLIFSRRFLEVDSGIKPFGSKVLGQPQRVIQWQDAHHSYYYVLITTLTVYLWAESIQDWIPIPTTLDVPCTTVGTLHGLGLPTIAVTFTGTANWTTGQIVSIPMASGRRLTGIAGGTASPMILTGVMPLGESITTESIHPCPLLTSDGTRPTSYAVDPTQNWLMFVNGFDAPMKFDTTTIEVIPGTAAAGIQSARYIARYHSVTVLGWTFEGGADYLYRLRRSATGNSSVWTGLDAGFDDLSDSGDDIHGIMLVNPYLVILRRYSIVRASYYGVGTQVFYYDYGLTNSGTIGQNSWTTTKNDSIVVAESGIYSYRGDQVLVDVGDKIFNYVLNFSGDMNPGARNTMFLFYVSNTDETWLAYAGGRQTTPNTILRYNHKTGGWWPRVFGLALNFQGYGFYSGAGVITWEQEVGSWLADKGAWNSQSIQANYKKVLLCGSTDNQVYLYDFSQTSTDNGDKINWIFESKDFVLPEDWENIDGVTLYGQGSIEGVEISTDFGMTFQSINLQFNAVTGVSNIAPVMFGNQWSRADVDVSLTAQYVRIRLSGNDPAFKLSWMAIKHIPVSER